MGTGIISVLLESLPYRFNGLHAIAVVFFGINLFLFCLFFVITVIRFVLWPKLLLRTLLHPVNSMFLGAPSMGFTMLINMCVLGFISEGRHHAFAIFLWVLWWINAVFSICILILIPFLKATRQSHELKTVTGVWILPIVAVIVTASAGAIVADVLPKGPAKITLTVAFMMMGAGLSLIFLQLAIYYARLVFMKIPPANVILSVFLPLGPCEAASFGVLHLAESINKLRTDLGEPFFAPSAISPQDSHLMDLGILGFSTLVSLGLWGFGFFWFVLALFVIGDLLMVTRFSFNLGWWGMVFPLGVFGLATMQLGSIFDSGSFKVLSVVITLAVIVVWLAMIAATLAHLLRGRFFYDPCVGDTDAAPTTTGHERKYTY
ncbi:hypothetical protein MNAN1_001538 [Malassezia nana]|uniref:Sulfite efflux pump SSU1 n=1 Tax=Malassezia nana TaxID=180528 RepID=A0AAF0EL69_9BASI|nr:hypothetical protein MNAN1_001538 [Malassezia nana]